MRKPIEQILSGEQLVTEHGAWDRVHGVSDQVDGVVIVRTDEHSGGREYPVGTLVTVIH